MGIQFLGGSFSSKSKNMGIQLPSNWELENWLVR